MTQARSRNRLDKELRAHFKLSPKRGFFDPRSVLRLGEQQPRLLCVVQHRGIMVQFPKDEKDMSIPVTTVEAGKIIGASSGEFLGSPSARTRPLRIGETRDQEPSNAPREQARREVAETAPGLQSVRARRARARLSRQRGGRY
jgi:hypothetical protein